MAEKNESRIVLRRSKEARILREIGIVAYLILVLLFSWAFITGWQEEAWITFLALLLFFLRGFLVCIREVFRKILLLENYISFTPWYGLHRVFAYDQICTVETVVVDENKWTWEPETHVRVTFNDGSSVKVHKSLMSVREFRKLLRERTGRTFRKPSKIKQKTQRS